MAKKTHVKVRMVPEAKPDSPYFYYVKKPAGGEKAKVKLSAKKYNPDIVIDLATLTGAAAQAIGHYGIVSMHKNSIKDHNELKDAGNEMHERLAEFPFWDDYDKLLDSDIADIKNIGGSFAGAITAGKFLSKFISYPWIHLDIAGPTFVKERYGYRGKGATGIGVRLLYNFIKKRY